MNVCLFRQGFLAEAGFLAVLEDRFAKRVKQWSLALGPKQWGAQPGVRHVIQTDFDLSANLNFGNTRNEHSAQLTRPIQTAWGYYDQVLRSFQLQPVNRQ